MSKKFEDIVLKKLEKLDTLESNFKDTDQLIKEKVLTKLDALEENVKSTDKLIKEQVLKRLDILETEMKDNNCRLGNLEIEIKDTQEVVKYLNQNFTKFDYEINKKIDTLFDSDTVNKENIVSLNTKTFSHDTRISNLENKDLKLIKL